MAERLLAYADRISAAPGERIAIKVSAPEGGEFQAKLIRLICGDDSPEGPGFKAEDIQSPIAASYPAGADRVRAAYPVAGYKSPTVAWGTIQSDQRACSDQTLRDRLANNTKTYVYEFAERNGPPFTSIWRLGTDYPFGATHVNDLGYLWDYLGTALPFNSAQVDLSDQMISYWGAFARTGNPNPKFAPTWPRHTNGGDLLQFVAPSAQRVSHATIDNEHNCALWNEVSPSV